MDEPRLDPDRADAIARAFLQPDARRDANRHRQAREAWWLREKRKVAALALAGFPVGALAAHQAGERFMDGALWGALAGGALGWLWIGWRYWRNAG